MSTNPFKVSLQLRPMNREEDLVWQVFTNDNQWIQSLRRIAEGAVVQDKRQRMSTFINRYPQYFENIDMARVNKLKVYMHVAESSGWLCAVPVNQWHPYIDTYHSNSDHPMTIQDWGDFVELEKLRLASIEEGRAHGLRFEHMGTVTGRFHPNGVNKSNTPKEEDMKAEITHRTEINGTDINEMSHSDLIHTIQNVESKIETLEKIKAESSYVHDEIGRLKKFVTEVVNLLDEK